MTHVLVAQVRNTKIAMAKRLIGLMSGTSLDGVDAVLVNNSATKILSQVYLPYSQSFKEKLRKLTSGAPVYLEELARLDQQVAQYYCEAVQKLLTMSECSAEEVLAIGSHGQTVFHHGGQYSMQIGNGALIAEKTGISVVCDFRMSDIAAQGQGAPLTPKYHQYLLQNKSAIVVNLGGIANLTQIEDNQVLGFDTGPANTLLDNWIKQHKELDYDRDGIWARSGFVDQALLKKLLNDAYFEKKWPKSTGPEYFNLAWLESYLKGGEAPQDVQRTLVELTAVTISQYIKEGLDVYLCGGGVHNLFLLERIAYLNPNNHITTTQDLGVSADYIEAAAFAFFAKQTLESKPSNIISVSGATKEKILGAIYAA